MSAARSAVFAIFCFSICATAQTRTLAVYPGPADRLDSLSIHALETELQRILAPAGIDLAWRQDAKHQQQEEEGYLVVGSFSGSCSVETLPPIVAGSNSARTLADTAVSNNRILPYFRVDCGHIIRTLAPLLQHLSVPFREAILGRAMARVIAHEIYHILARTADHASVGLAKSQLSLDELTATRFDLHSASLMRMQTSFGSKSSRSSGEVVTLGAKSRTD